MNFTRGGNPYHKLKIGRTAIVENWFREHNMLNASYEVDDDGKNIIINIDGDLFLEKPPTFEWPVKVRVTGYMRFLTEPPPPFKK